MFPTLLKAHAVYHVFINHSYSSLFLQSLIKRSLNHPLQLPLLPPQPHASTFSLNCASRLMKSRPCVAIKASHLRSPRPLRSAAGFLSTLSRNGITHSDVFLLLLSSSCHHHLHFKLCAWPGLWVCKTTPDYR